MALLVQQYCASPAQASDKELDALTSRRVQLTRTFALHQAPARRVRRSQRRAHLLHAGIATSDCVLTSGKAVEHHSTSFPLNHTCGDDLSSGENSPLLKLDSMPSAVVLLAPSCNGVCRHLPSATGVRLACWSCT